jgi:hypothetical protein
MVSVAKTTLIELGMMVSPGGGKSAWDSLGKGFTGLDDYIPDPRNPGEVIENPRNLEVIKQFVGSIKAPDRAEATNKQNIMEGQGIDDLGTCKSLLLMEGRMHLQIQIVSVAKTTLIGLGMMVSPEGDGKRKEVREGERPGRQMERHKQRGDRGQGKKAVPERALVCTTCGRTGHVSATCYHRRHPDANHAHTTWKESVPGKAWTARGFATLPTDRTLRRVPAAPGRGDNRGEMIPLCISCNNLMASIPIEKDFDVKY